jgi:hypothetical protein
MGLSLNSIVLEVSFKNLRADDGAIKRIRILHRGGAKKAVVPPEVPNILTTQQSIAVLGLDFGATSGAAGVVKMELKTDRGAYPFELHVPLEETLSPLELSADVFASEAKKLAGFQKTTAAVKIDANQIAGVNDAVLACASVMSCGGELEYAGTLSGGEKLLVRVELDGAGAGSVNVFSENALASNTICASVKEAVLGAAAAAEASSSSGYAEL